MEHLPNLVTLNVLHGAQYGRAQIRRWSEEPTRYRAYTRRLAHHIFHLAPPQSALSLLVFGKDYLCKETSEPLGNGQLGYKPEELGAPSRQCYLPPSVIGTRSVTTIDACEAKYFVLESNILDYVYY